MNNLINSLLVQSLASNTRIQNIVISKVAIDKFQKYPELKRELLRQRGHFTD